MFNIEANLPSELYPLAWLVGKWCGWAALTAEEGQPLIVLETEFRVEGTTLVEETTAWKSTGGEDLPVVASAKAGWDALQKTDEFFKETAVWQVEGVRELPQIDPATGRTTILSELKVTSSGGLHGVEATWFGNGQGPRLGLAASFDLPEASASEASSSGSADNPGALTELNRMYGLVMGELMWAQDATIAGKPDTELAVRLGRIEDVTGIAS